MKAKRNKILRQAGLIGRHTRLVPPSPSTYVFPYLSAAEGAVDRCPEGMTPQHVIAIWKGVVTVMPHRTLVAKLHRSLTHLYLSKEELNTVSMISDVKGRSCYPKVVLRAIKTYIDPKCHYRPYRKNIQITLHREIWNALTWQALSWLVEAGYAPEEVLVLQLEYDLGL